jgi:hypothetical protein
MVVVVVVMVVAVTRRVVVVVVAQLFSVHSFNSCSQSSLQSCKLISSSKVSIQQEFQHSDSNSLHLSKQARWPIVLVVLLAFMVVAVAAVVDSEVV